MALPIMWMCVLNEIIYQVKCVFFKVNLYNEKIPNSSEWENVPFPSKRSITPGGRFHKSVVSWLKWDLERWLTILDSMAVRVPYKFFSQWFPTNSKDRTKILIWEDLIRKVYAKTFWFQVNKNIFTKYG